jgi:hypothetical protein
MPAADEGRKHGNGEMEEREEQLGFELGEERQELAYSPNLTHVREDMQSILDEARSAIDAPPWDARTLRYKTIVFVQMAKWLPDEEAEQLRFEFMQEVERIEQLLAA